MTTKMSQEAKKDEFRKYLEKAGVLELLTKSLVQLYEVRPFNKQFQFFICEAIYRKATIVKCKMNLSPIVVVCSTYASISSSSRSLFGGIFTASP